MTIPESGQAAVARLGCLRPLDHRGPIILLYRFDRHHSSNPTGGRRVLPSKKPTKSVQGLCRIQAVFSLYSISSLMIVTMIQYQRTTTYSDSDKKTGKLKRRIPSGSHWPCTHGIHFCDYSRTTRDARLHRDSTDTRADICPRFITPHNLNATIGSPNTRYSFSRLSTTLLRPESDAE